MSTMRCKENYILVLYGNGVYGNVKDTLIDELIEKGEIKKFYRSDGWVTIGTNSIRTRRNHYNGLEKRKLSKKR
jgi:NDP-sugar pyrophosphorylase family protein